MKNVDTIRVPVTLRWVITKHNLAGNDIAILMLVIERTMGNISPPKDVTLLSIRYIAGAIGCSEKGAWNSVAKLKRCGLVNHEVSDNRKMAATLSLNLSAFVTEDREAPSVAGARPNSAPLESPPDKVVVARELEEIREILYLHVNLGKIERELDLPEVFLAASLLEYFGSSSAVEAWVERLHTGWKKSRYRAKGYGICSSSLKKLRDADLNSSIGRLLQAVPATEPFVLPTLLSSRSKYKEIDRGKANFVFSQELRDEIDYDYHEDDLAQG